MNKVAVLSVLCLLAAPLASALLTNAEVQTLVSKAGVKAAHFIGNKYWTEDTVGTWASAKARCETLGMRLATIRTAEEGDFLKSAFHTTNFNGGHWIAGRDEGDIRQFAWDSPPHEQPNANLIPWRPVVLEPLTCLYWFSATPVSSVRVSQGPCSTAYRALCEAVSD